MKVYHGSPNGKIDKLYDGSYVTIFPHIAWNMGLFYKNTGKTWKNDDLTNGYNFGPKIKFKKNRIPDGQPTLYQLNINVQSEIRTIL